MKKLASTFCLLGCQFVLATTLLAETPLASSPAAQTSTPKNTEYAGQVFGEKISKEEFDFQYKTASLFSVSPKNITNEAERRQATWQNIVLLKTADRQNLTVPKEEFEKE